MRELTVLFDRSCGLCRRARDWLGRQPQLVHLRFVPLQSPDARRLLPGIPVEDLMADLTVVDETGRYWRGGKAWVMCLWALARYRGWAVTLSSPRLFAHAKRFVGFVSRNRKRVWR